MKQINIILVFLILVIAGIPFFLDDHFEEKLTYEIEAPIGLVYDEFSDFDHFSKWEEFTSADTAALKKSTKANEEEDDEKDFADWKSSKSSVGNGKITIENFEINQSIEYKIEYEAWEGDDLLRINMKQLESGNTALDVYYLSQEIPYFYRYFTLFNSPMKKVENTLVSFNELVKVRLDKERKEGKMNYGEFRVVEVDQKIMMAIKKTSTLHHKDALSKFDEAITVIYKSLANEEGAYDFDLGFPLVYTLKIDQEAKERNFFVGISIDKDFPIKRGMQKVIVPKGDYLLTIHQGPRSKRKNTIDLMHKFALKNKIKLGERELEVFLNDPKETDSLQLKSRIYIPVSAN